MSLRYHEISEGRHRILNPFTDAKLDLLLDIIAPRDGWRVLDLCCGKAELLCRMAQRARIDALGVDISPVFLEAARARAVECGVADRVRVAHADARTHEVAQGALDVVGCIGATWIGGGLTGTLGKMKPGLRNRDSLLLVGEPYWIDPPPAEAIAVTCNGDADLFTSLDGTRERIESCGLELVEMVLADGDSWDRYAASQWRTMSDWLRDNPGHPEAPALRAALADARRAHLRFDRRYLGWGVFVTRLA